MTESALFASSDGSPGFSKGEAPRGVHDSVAARAAANPHATAIATSRETLTYGQLDARANAIAGELVASGVGPDVVVGLCVPRSAEMVLGALAILKAGGAYLPLDPLYPAERRRFILEDAGCRLLLTGSSQGPAESPLPSGEIRVVPIDCTGPWAPHPPESNVAPHHLAYVIYTSGSTGRPKGVEIAHKSLHNLVHWHRETFGLKPSDRTSQVAAVGFDAAVWEIWPTLAAGASLHLPDEEIRTDPQALRDWVVSQRIDVGFFPTPMAERLLALPWPKATALRYLLTGGDVLHAYPPPGLPFVLVNNYGPTECTVVATSGFVRSFEQPDARPTIGRPIDHTRIHIVNDQLREVADGAVGQLCIAGAGVGRGYRHRPELTAQRFVDNPFRAQDGAEAPTLYLTGDTARQLPDGQIAFVGRMDEQLKVRGFRIEPNEIAAALHRHPAVAACTVTASDLGGGEKRLVAYLVLADGSRATASELQQAARERLPEYMVPAIFVRLDAIPLGPHGKVDRTALPEPNPSNILRDADSEQPRTPVEQTVAALLKQLLRVEDLGIDDNFFLLGGHSLMGTQLIARIRNEFGVEMSLRSVFDSPTVAGLAAEVEGLLVAKLDAMSEDEALALLPPPEARL